MKNSFLSLKYLKGHAALGMLILSFVNHLTVLTGGKVLKSNEASSLLSTETLICFQPLLITILKAKTV